MGIMDGTRTSMNRLRAIAIVLAIAVVSSAHVGSPDVFFDGTAGPYVVHIRVAPPTVVPGVAWVFVRTADTDIKSILIRPVYWRAGAHGAPPGDSLAPVVGEKGLYSGKIWMMSRGAYSVYVDVNGARGAHTAIVPVMALATTRLGLSRGLMVILIALGVLLFSGLVAIVRAAASDSLVSPGAQPDQSARRRGSLGAIIAVPVLALAIFGGAKWWQAEDTAYRRTMFRPLAGAATVVDDRRFNVLRLAILDTAPERLISAAIMPDHGKMMHLFLVREPMSVFVHLHPRRENDSVFSAIMPPVPPGRYIAFGDIVLETGAEYTVSTDVEVPGAIADASSDPDDSWLVDTFGVPARAGALAHLNTNMDLRWDSADTLVAGRDVNLAFTVVNRRGQVTPIQPYLGMAAHGVIIREDASVFVHLHPMGTVTMASQQAFAQRDVGDTTDAGRLRPIRGMDMASPKVTMDGTFSFPYAFPKAGRYRMWVQVKLAGHVETADFEVTVK
jgi:hypothetical protein